jgi:hypothetical protein
MRKSAISTSANAFVVGSAPPMRERHWHPSSDTNSGGGRSVSLAMDEEESLSLIDGLDDRRAQRRSAAHRFILPSTDTIGWQAMGTGQHCLI